MARQPLDELRTYITMLPIQKHRLDDELEVQADIMYRISENVVRRTSAANALKNELEKLDAVIISELKASGTKGAVSVLSGAAKGDKEREQLYDRYQVAVVDQQRWEGLLESWRARGFALTTLANLYSANYFSPTSTYDSSKKEPTYEELRKDVESKRAGQQSRTSTRRKLNLTEE